MKEPKIKSKLVSPAGRYRESFKKKVVQEYEQGFLNKDQLQQKYGIGGHSRILQWCRKYGNLHYPEKSSLGRPMKDPQKQRIKDLEKQLEDARLKLLAYEKLIATAETEQGISILKKDVVKQSVSCPKSTQEK